jgi:Zn-finger nucleic acid-binding protein
MRLDICYGGCGGIWFDQTELEHMDPRASISLFTIWRHPRTEVSSTEARICPRCPNEPLNRKVSSEMMRVEVGQCPKCGGLWLDEREFSKIYKASGGEAVMPFWAVAMADAAIHPPGYRRGH